MWYEQPQKGKPIREIFRMVTFTTMDFNFTLIRDAETFFKAQLEWLFRIQVVVIRREGSLNASSSFTMESILASGLPPSFSWCVLDYISFGAQFICAMWLLVGHCVTAKFSVSHTEGMQEAYMKEYIGRTCLGAANQLLLTLSAVCFMTRGRICCHSR